MSPDRSQHGEGAFTLIELLLVVAIMAILMTLSGPMLAALSGANSVDKAVADLSSTLERARAYAMANSTYVRVGFGAVAKSPGHPLPEFVVVSLYSTDGTPNVTDMTQWPEIGRPLILRNFVFSDNLGTPTDVTPDATSITSFTRTVGNLGVVTFAAGIQFSPSGTAQVQLGTPSRFIKVALDRPAPQNGKNPFVIRLGGLSGAVEILRAENL